MSVDTTQNACMMRVRNEARWIAWSLERSFAVVDTIVVLDDGSDDLTGFKILSTLMGAQAAPDTRAWRSGTIKIVERGPKSIHYIKSPFRPAARNSQAVSEIRDKNFLWEYCKAKVRFTHMLCLDGDEVLSREFIEGFDEIQEYLETQADVVTIPFIYLWDGDDQIRVDGIYGNLDDGAPRLRFPRLFTIKRVTHEQLHIMRFAWEGSKGGFHCGSVPRENFKITVNGQLADIAGATYLAPVIHLGYRDAADRLRKYKFYNFIDPGNQFEGEYRHIIGEPNIHAPGPVELKPWVEE